MRGLVFLLLVFVSPVSFGEPASNNVLPLDQRIQMLMGSIADSSCQFVRNGKSHSASASVQHIEKKYAHYRDDIESIESFIELTAPRSLISGKPYQIKCDQLQMSSADWLLEKARQMDLSS